MKRAGQTQSKVLVLLRQHNRPMSAYALLAEMRDDNPRLAPTSIYRALTTLIEQGAVHRLESTNSFVACQHGKHQCAYFMAICDGCGGVEERLAPNLIDDLFAETAKTGFTPTRHVIEVHGHCAACATGGVQ